MQEPLESLLARCQPGWSLPQEFYSDETVYRRDLTRVWRTGWLFAGHSCEIPDPGDYFTLELDTDSVILIRDETANIQALHNVCRHRGSALCDQSSGRVTRLVCPYHQWVYGFDGRLLACRGMHEIDRSQFGLQKVAVEEVEGLIFISFATMPAPFESARESLAPLLEPQGMRVAKVAKVANYIVKANWKLVWENNRECYHCHLNHPQYIKANFDHFNADDITPSIQEKLSSAVAKVESAAPVGDTRQQAGMTTFPDAERNIWFSANRTPLIEGYVSESMDGEQVAPLMGEYRSVDVGTLRVRALPNFWNHSSCDHAVSTRLLPLGPQLTSVRVWWLVDESAVEGQDYELSKLTPFWQLTSEQDWEICERQQRGVNSSAYMPGPYSTFKEYNVDSFVKWYLKMIR